MRKHLARRPAFRHFRIPAAPTLTLAALLGFSGALPSSIRAATYTWTGNGGTTSWSNGGNWSGGSAPALGQDTSLLFTGTTNLTSYQNITKQFELNALTFDSAADAFVLGGNVLSFYTSSTNVLPTLTQNSAAAEAVSNDLMLTNNFSLGGTGAGALTLSGALSGAGSLTMAGTSTAVLTGTNTYTGGTALNAGTLNVGSAQALGTSGTLSFAGGTLQYSAASAGTDFSARFSTAGNQAIHLDTNGNTSGSATGTGAVQVQSGGTLGGNGTLAGAVTVQSGGTLAPGELAVSRLTLGSNLALNNGSTLAITLGGNTAGTGYDQVQLSGQLTLAGNLSVSTVNGFKLAVGQTFVILDDTGNTVASGFFTDTTAGALYTDTAGDTFLVNYLDNADGGTVPNDVSLTVTSVVPEPSSLTLLGLGGAGLVGLTLRRQRRAGLL